ncbi:hypothetical protein ROZALSC1DRAFT_24209 [Rozella allomycis CSF55]|uniref:MULE transposase domain-containing protein n=1 Tax=Rozella allomycis (strain CSF55) TaxID=988480 RepID=A0A4P9YFQ0_ROZAC|nr:hypothetical protein ROZALSC1DRAFT_24209 [Rozella allomycis CSF55]
MPHSNTNTTSTPDSPTTHIRQPTTFGSSAELTITTQLNNLKNHSANVVTAMEIHCKLGHISFRRLYDIRSRLPQGPTCNPNKMQPCTFYLQCLLVGTLLGIWSGVVGAFAALRAHLSANSFHCTPASACAFTLVIEILKCFKRSTASRLLNLFLLRVRENVYGGIGFRVGKALDDCYEFGEGGVQRPLRCHTDLQCCLPAPELSNSPFGCLPAPVEATSPHLAAYQLPGCLKAPMRWLKHCITTDAELIDPITPNEILKYGVKLRCGSDTNPFTVGFTSQCLIKNLCQAYNTADGKIVLSGNELIVVGYIDVAGHFRLTKLMLSSHRRGTDYDDILRPLFEQVNIVLGSKVTPLFLMSNGSDAIYNGFLSVLPENAYVHLMCFARAERNIKKTINQLKIFRISRSLQECQLHYNELTSTCQKEANRQSFVTPPGYPLTNNSIESFNKQIKTQYPERDRLSFGELFAICGEIIKDYGTGPLRKEFSLHRPSDAALAKRGDR